MSKKSAGRLEQKTRDKLRGSHYGQNLKLGKRYVFFSSLNEYAHKGYSLYIYANALVEGQSYVAQALALLSNNPGKNALGSLGNIELYINFVADLMNNAHSNETAFLKEFYNLYKNKKNGIPESLEKKFLALQKSDYANYTAFIGAIDEIMAQRSDAAKARTQAYDDLMSDYQTHIDTLKKSEIDSAKYSDLRDAFTRNLGEFNQKFNALIVSGMETFHETYANQVADKINSIIYNLALDDAFIALMQNTYIANTNISPKEFGPLLFAYVTKEVSAMTDTELTSKTGKELADIFMDNFKKTNGLQFSLLSKEYIETVNNQITKKNGKQNKSIEELALTTGRGTSAKFLELNDPIERQAFLDRYFPVDKMPEERKKLEGFFKSVKNDYQQATTFEKLLMSKLINASIISKAQEEFENTITRESWRKLEKEMPEKVLAFYRTNTEDILKSCLAIKISGSSISEVTASEEFLLEIVKAVITPGKQILLKNDITAVILFNKNIFNTKTRSKKLLAVLDVLTNIPSSFIRKYHDEAKNSTNMKVAQEKYIEVYLNAITDLLSIYNGGEKELKQYQEALQALHDMFVTGVSIKDYQYGTNEFGFHGGSLGSDLENIISNISLMYELGGISMQDAELLQFAAANCGEDMLGASLKEPLQTYLLGAAAVLMFDEGFTDISGFLDKMRSKLNGFDGSKPLHLFRLQTHYVPASFVYSTIYYNLEAAYHSISSEFIPELMTKASNSVIINNINSGAIPNYKEVPLPLDRWDAVSQEANSSTLISFIFMAGLLDVFEAIGNAFAI